MGKQIDYTPSPTVQALWNSPKNINGIRGPVGSGKSVGCCFYIWLKSMMQRPGRDGVVRNRWLILRNTLPELRDTTVQTWLHWFPMTEMNWTPPYHGLLVMPHYRNPRVRVEIELIFYGCDQPDFEEKLKSLEITGVWANEACQIRWNTLQQAYSRCGRYPSKEGDLSFYSWGLLMDTNSPSDSNWWYRKECVERPPDMAFFVQPPALLEHVRPDGSKWYEPNRGQDPADPRPAENVEHLNEGFQYYMKQVSVLDDDEIKRLLLNQFGTSLAGKPIYPEFKDSVHVSKAPLEFNAGMTLILGTDFGRTPACVIGQMSNTGQIRILEEVVSEGMGITQFTDELLRPLLVRKYRLLEGTRVVNFADPSGGSGTQVDDITCIQRMNERGVYTKPCRALVNNSFVQRRECVSDLLRSRRDGEPALIIDPSCEWLRKGFNGGYCYQKMRTPSGGDERYADTPDKTNPFSHPHDALQYLCVGAIYGDEDYSIPHRHIGGGSWRQGLFSAGIDVGGFGV